MPVNKNWRLYLYLSNCIFVYLHLWKKVETWCLRVPSSCDTLSCSASSHPRCRSAQDSETCNTRYKFEQNPQNFLAKLSSFWLFQHQLKFEQKLQNDFNFFATFATSATKLNKSCKMLKTFYFAILQHRLWIWTKVAKCSKLMAKLSIFWLCSHLSIVLSKIWLSIVFSKNTSV